MTASHLTGTNGRIWTELVELDGPVDDQLRRRLSLLDGADRYSLILWKLPKGMHPADVDPPAAVKEYIQAAGSSDKLTVEVRRPTQNGPEHFTVGRPPKPQPEIPPSVTLHWDQYAILVHPNEVFTADEAADLFTSYYRTQWVPDSYTLRPLDLGRAT